MTATARTNNGSGDGYFGDSAFATGQADPSVVDGTFCARSSDSKIHFRIWNNTTENVTIEKFVWDQFAANNASNGGPDSSQFYYDSGNLTNATGTYLYDQPTYDEGGFPPDGTAIDMRDYSVDLSAVMTDNVLAPGEYADFVLRETGSAGPPLFIDNVAFIGSVPEPATMGLLGMGALAMLRRRRRQR